MMTLLVIIIQNIYFYLLSSVLVQDKEIRFFKSDFNKKVFRKVCQTFENTELQYFLLGNCHQEC